MGETGSGEVGVITAAGLGVRIRALRRAAGLSQAELADGRFSKEYVSQLERGKTRPSAATLAWLAARLGTEVSYLETGVSGADRERAEAALQVAEDLSQAGRNAEAAPAFAAARAAALASGSAALVHRAHYGESWSHVRMGHVDDARRVLEQAWALAETGQLGDLERGELAFLEGLCRYTESDIARAIDALGEALVLAERSPQPSDRLRADVHGWRSRCYRRLRDLEAAREDAERALELAEARPDPARAADALFQASLVAQREGRWILARTAARRAKDIYASIGDRATVGRLLNNLAGLDHLLGNIEEAVAQLHEAFDLFVDLGLDVESGYILSSLADVYVDTGDPARAEPLARRALALLDGRLGHEPEAGSAHLVLGRALLLLGREAEARVHLELADDLFETAASPSHRAEAWIAEGDLARQEGDDREAARLYRRAALTLQDTVV